MAQDRAQVGDGHRQPPPGGGGLVHVGHERQRPADAVQLGERAGDVAGEYRSVASGDISGAIDALSVAQSHLATQQSQLQSAQDQAQAALAEAAAARQGAQATVANQQATLAQVKGQIAHPGGPAPGRPARRLARRLPRPGRRRRTGRLGRGPTVRPGPSCRTSPPRAEPPPPSPLPRARSACPTYGGARAPGGGFDCSGLTQWAWRQAGVDLPRTAAAQYDAVAHVPLSDLQPGDLVFWGYGGISHVGMYVGGGNIIDAPDTGELVRIQAIWNNGLVGAGRP